MIFRRALELESLLRWTLAATPLGSTGRPTAERRLGMLKRAWNSDVEDPEAAEHLPRLLLLLSSPMAALFWKDCLGVNRRGG